MNNNKLFLIISSTIFIIFSSDGFPQITKLDDWIAFKYSTRDVKLVDKVIGKLRQTYDFFHNSDNTSNVDKILLQDDNLKLKLNQNDNNDNVDVELTTVRESSIGKIPRGNEWLEPLEPLEIVDNNENNNENVDRSVEFITPKPNYQLPLVIIRAFAKWLASILGFTQSSYLKIAQV